MLLQTVGMPFDSIVADAASAADALKHKFEGSLEPHNLHVHEDYTLDSRYKIEYWHEFHDKKNPYLDLDRVCQKRAFVVDRFYKLLTSHRRLLFVRHETPGYGSLDDLAPIIDAIEMHRPPHLSHFLYLSDQISDGETDKITTVNVPKAMILPDAYWDKAMGIIHSRERIKGYHPSLVSAYQKWPEPLRTQTFKIIGTVRKRRTQLGLAAG
jgi:hypothetical protein